MVKIKRITIVPVVNGSTVEVETSEIVDGRIYHTFVTENDTMKTVGEFAEEKINELFETHKSKKEK